MSRIEVAQLVRESMASRDLSVRAVAQAAGVGVGTVQRIRRGQVDATPGVLRSIAGPLGLTTAQLMRAAGYL